jgi:hypothetical protein
MKPQEDCPPETMFRNLVGKHVKRDLLKEQKRPIREAKEQKRPIREAKGFYLLDSSLPLSPPIWTLDPRLRAA